MGTTVSVDVRDAGLAFSVVEAAIDELRTLEARFSPFLPGSEVSRYGRGEVTAAEMSADLAEILAACERLRDASGGAFDPWGHDASGTFDPSGYVKGWAGDRAAAVLRAGGARRFSIDLGGDVVCAGEPEPGRPWRVGIRHPDDPSQVVLVLGIRDGAVATSGLYERGTHVRDARDGTVADHWDSITVIAATLTEADALATVGLLLGPDGPAFVASRGAELAAVRGGRLVTSAGVDGMRLT